MSVDLVECRHDSSWFTTGVTLTRTPGRALGRVGLVGLFFDDELGGRGDVQGVLRVGQDPQAFGHQDVLRLGGAEDQLLADLLLQGVLEGKQVGHVGDGLHPARAVGPRVLADQRVAAALEVEPDPPVVRGRCLLGQRHSTATTSWTSTKHRTSSAPWSTSATAHACSRSAPTAAVTTSTMPSSARLQQSADRVGAWRIGSQFGGCRHRFAGGTCPDPPNCARIRRTVRAFFGADRARTCRWTGRGDGSVEWVGAGAGDEVVQAHG
ncbi:hypothetical protein J2S63_004123 [Marmoricola bigeumensis]|uniref:Uncharacterized protein n=1 Tax=Nocardioides marmoribigeumensis TaxID=433649 RepID=A0ABU2C1P9_9ACTN|nr:hypothetical protein [Nocardioides marmoribigeumensis]